MFTFLLRLLRIEVIGRRRGSINEWFTVWCLEVLYRFLLFLLFCNICSDKFDLRFPFAIEWVVIVLNVEIYCESNVKDVLASTAVWFGGSDLTENGSFIYFFFLFLDIVDVRPSNNLTVKDELEIVLFEEQKECINNGSRGLGWKCNSSKMRTIRKRKIITMTFSLNGEGAIISRRVVVFI